MYAELSVVTPHSSDIQTVRKFIADEMSGAESLVNRACLVPSMTTSSVAKMKLWCGFYGEATVFSVEIARNADVEALQEAVADKIGGEKLRRKARLVTLYLARKRDVWLKVGKSVKGFLRGEIDSEYEEMEPSRELKEYFGSDF